MTPIVAYIQNLEVVKKKAIYAGPNDKARFAVLDEYGFFFSGYCDFDAGIMTIVECEQIGRV